MKDVNIYIYTEYSGTFAKGSGKYHVILETTIEDKNGNIIPYTNEDGKNPKPVMGIVENITKNRLDLLALNEALSHICKRSRIIIHTQSDYITGAFIQGWPEKWIKNDYKNGNKPIRHADLWRDIMEKIEKNDVTFMKAKSTPYMRVQIDKLKNLKETDDD